MPKKKRRPRKPVRRQQQRPRPKRAENTSMGQNVISYALSQGVDVTDPAALDAFMAFYNGLPHELRVAISDRDWSEDSDDEWLDDEEDAWLADSDDDTFPDFLGELPSAEALEAHAAGVDEHAFYIGATLMRRADLVLRHIGEGHTFTDEDGLGLPATIALLDEFGSAADDVETMWDVPPLSGLIAGLAGGGFLQLSAGQVRPAAMVRPWAWPDAPPEDRIDVGRVLYATTLSAFFEETEEGSAALAGPFTAWALLSACGPDGLRLSEGEAGADEYEALRQNVRADFLALADLGIIERDGDVFTASPTLLTVLPAVLEDVTGEQRGSSG